jgi:hypothetical protein
LLDNEFAQAVALIAHDLAVTLDWDPQQAATFAEQTVSVQRVAQEAR